MEVMEELCPGCPEWKIRRELSLLVEEDALWRPFETLSGGEKRSCSWLHCFAGGLPFHSLMSRLITLILNQERSFRVFKETEGIFAGVARPSFSGRMC